jgi:hypothetical protein
MNLKHCPFESLIGDTITKIDGLAAGNTIIEIETDKGSFRMFHEQDCCERVEVDSVVGDASELVGEKVLAASVKSSPEDGLEHWTFYDISTRKGTVVIRW